MSKRSGVVTHGAGADVYTGHHMRVVEVHVKLPYSWRAGPEQKYSGQTALVSGTYMDEYAHAQGRVGALRAGQFRG